MAARQGIDERLEIVKAARCAVEQHDSGSAAGIVDEKRSLDGL